MNERKIAYRANADDMARHRDDWIARNEAYYADDLRYMRFLVPENARILDIGCGTGRLLAALRPSHGVGIDLSPAMVERARTSYPGHTFLVGDAEDPAVIAGIDGVFDCIILSDTIGMFDDIEEALKGLHSLCGEGTRIVISYFSSAWEPVIAAATALGWRMPQPEVNLLSTTDYLNLLRLSDLEAIRMEKRQLLPVKMLGLGRLVNRFVAPLPVVRSLCLRTYLVARSMRAERCAKLTTSIVIPCRNEQGNIERALKEMPSFGGHQEIIFVEGHSSDGTYAECLRVQEVYAGRWDIKVLRQQGKGKGDAVRRGFEAATGDVLVILDADLTVAPSALPKFYDAITSGKGEFINGTRLVYPMESNAMRLLNHIANRFFALLFTYLLNQRFTDTLCGTKVLKRSDYLKIAAARSYFGEFDPFGDYDLIFGAAKQNLRFIEIPIHYKARTYGETQISRFRDGWLLVRMVLFAFRKLKAI